MPLFLAWQCLQILVHSWEIDLHRTGKESLIHHFVAHTLKIYIKRQQNYLLYRVTKFDKWGSEQKVAQIVILRK